jgi:hypothetical protein
MDPNIIQKRLKISDLKNSLKINKNNETINKNILNTDQTSKIDELLE